nr:LysR family transcriptional regulator [Streptomyces sp. AK04-4c]
MDIRKLENFLSTVDCGGSNRVAAVPSRPPAQAVRALEHNLGSQLFHRIGRRAVLTEAGRTLVETVSAGASIVFREGKIHMVDEAVTLLRLQLAAQALTTAERTHEMAVEHVVPRRRFGKDPSVTSI